MLFTFISVAAPFFSKVWQAEKNQSFDRVLEKRATGRIAEAGWRSYRAQCTLQYQQTALRGE